MRNSVIISLLISLCLSVAPRVGAQTLHKDITVERASTPQKREAARIGILPSVWLPALSSSPLSYSDKVVSARVPNTISMLDPVAYGNTDSAAQYRGYVRAGLFPLFNADVSAGVNIVDNSSTRLTFQAQYNADLYRRGHREQAPSPNFDHGSKYMWRDHALFTGLSLHQTIGRKSVLEAGVSYIYGRHNMLSVYPDRQISQSISQVDVDALFATRIEAMEMKARLKAEHFGFYDIVHPIELMNSFGPGYYPGQGTPEFAPGQRQNRVVLGLQGELPASECSRFGLSVDVDLLRHVRPYAGQTIPFDAVNGTFHKKGVNGVYSLSPWWRMATDKANVRLGLKADLNSGSGSMFRIAPDVRLAWTPTQIFGVELRATGGTELNSLASLYSGVTPYLNPLAAYGRSHIPYALDARMSFGPFLNTSIEVFGGYAMAKSWLMPVESGLMPGGAVFESLRFKGHRLGVTLAYDNGRTLSVRASYTTAPSGHKRGWYEWRDRARHVVDARIGLRPMKPLCVEAGFEFRSGRAEYAYSPEPEPSGIGSLLYYPVNRVSLGTVANLSLGANYAVNSRFNVWARGINLLSRHHTLIGGRPSQGITGLVGVSYKF